MPQIRVIVFIACSVIAGFFGKATVFAEEILIIGNSSITEQSLPLNKIKEIFIGDMVKWENNDRVTIVLAEDDSVHADFLKQYIHRTPAQFQNVWRRNLFTGKGKQPTRVKSFDEMVEYVSKNKGAIGYIPSDKPIPPEIIILSKKT